jgi:hypothetical protein
MLNPAVFQFTTVENLRPVKLHCKRQPHHLPTQPVYDEPQASVEVLLLLLLLLLLCLCLFDLKNFLAHVG